MALAEIPLLVSMALAFVTSDGGFYVVLLGAVVSVVLLLVHVWPTERSVDRVADSLERGGTPLLVSAKPWPVPRPRLQATDCGDRRFRDPHPARSTGPAGTGRRLSTNRGSS